MGRRSYRAGMTVIIAGAVAAGTLTAAAAGCAARAGAVAGSWDRAIEVPGAGGSVRGRGRQRLLGVVRLGGQLRGRRGVCGPPRSWAGVRGRRAARPLGQGDRGARPGGPEHGRERQRQLGVVRLGGQLRGRRGLHGPPRSWAGVRGRRAARPLGQGDRGARPGGAEHGRGRLCLVGVVRLGGQLRGRRALPGPPPSWAGVRGRRAERRLGPGDRGARPGGAEQGRGASSSPRCRAARRATARLAGTTRAGTAISRGSWPSSGTASGARRSRCPAWRR